MRTSDEAYFRLARRFVVFLFAAGRFRLAVVFRFAVFFRLAAGRFRLAVVFRFAVFFRLVAVFFRLAVVFRFVAVFFRFVAVFFRFAAGRFRLAVVLRFAVVLRLVVVLRLAGRRFAADFFRAGDFLFVVFFLVAIFLEPLVIYVFCFLLAFASREMIRCKCALIIQHL
ncbi:MAG: hypothetical protein OXF09_01425 [Hyphomicrobiales bacterium]|nr:hypothetical protein [Hyphomicrobiales bacterium]